MKLATKKIAKQFNSIVVPEENDVGYTGEYHNFFPWKPIKKRSVIIETEDALKELCEAMMEISAFAYDTETNCLDAQADNSNFRCADITISWGEMNNYDIILGHVRDEDLDRNIDLEVAVKYLKPVFEREDVLIVGHNLKFDLHVIRRLGIKVRTKYLFDTMLASWICDENTPNGLKENSNFYMGVSQTKFKEVTESIPKEVKKMYGYSASAKVHDFSLVLVDEGSEYCTDDSFYTWCLYLGFSQLLEEEKMDKIFYQKMIPFLQVLLEMEEKGITVDIERLEKMRDEMQEDMDALQYEIYELAGVEFNISSSQQKCELLYGYEKPHTPIVYDKANKTIKAMFDAYRNKEIDKEELKSRLLKQDCYIDEKGKVFKLANRNYNLLEVNFGFQILAETKAGAPSCDKNTLARLSKLEFKNKRKRDGVRMCKLMLEYSKLDKLKGTFCDGILEKIEVYEDGKCHPNFNQIGTDSGRISCIEENQPIKCIGEDKPIKDVKVGDLVYCYDDEGNLCVRKVLRVIDNGVRPCVELKYKSTGTHKEGTLICTPDHKIRSLSGEWVEAQDLIKNQQITHLRRSNDVRPRLYGADSFCEQEQLVIKREVFNCTDRDMVIHHKDHNKGNNSISNLELMTRQEHTSLHSKVLLEEGKIDTVTFHSVPHRILSGKENPNYIDISAEELESLVREYKGRIRDIPMDFDTFKKKCAEVGFDYKKVAGEYQTRYREVSDEDFIKAFYDCKGVPYAISRKLNIGRTKVAKTIERLDLCYNHKVVEVKPIGNRRVYDLEVEEYHNFIASEICVHNCSNPNLQQLPKADEEDKYQIRSVFIGSPYYLTDNGYVCETEEEADEYCEEEYYVKRKKILAIDYHNLEMVCLTHFSHDKNLSEMFANDDDAHGSTAVNMFSLPCTPVECKKQYPHLRQAAKTINFMLMYGGGATTLYENLKYNPYDPLDLGAKAYLEQYDCKNGIEVAQTFIDRYFQSYSGVAKFIRDQKRYAHKNKFVYTILGRKRRLPDINSSNGELSSKAERLSVNAAIQGTAGDITSSAQIRLNKERDLEDMLCYMLLQIHDELVYELPEEYIEDCVNLIKYDMEHPFGDKANQQVEYLRADYDVGNNYQEAK